jgi:uncharacterized protein (UPF0276 family)
LKTEGLACVPPVALSLNNLGEVDEHLDVSRDDGDIPFVELLWDNFCHLDPHQIRDLMDKIAPVRSLHVMATSLIDRPLDDYRRLLGLLAEHVRVIQPARVSDHLVCYRLDHVRLPIPVEYDYADLPAVAERVCMYQDAIGQSLLIENHASTSWYGRRQIAFHQALSERTGCGLLFDVSNAVAADLNQVQPLQSWVDVLEGQKVHCHVGSHRRHGRTRRYHDTHDASPDRHTLLLLGRLAAREVVASVCYERDHGRTDERLRTDLGAVRAALGACDARGSEVSDGHCTAA